MIPWAILGNPENRRVGLFQEALAAGGRPPAEVVSWRAFLADPGALERLGDGPRLLRVDSFGEDFEVERALLRLGEDDARRDPLGPSVVGARALDATTFDLGRITSPRQLQLGLGRALDALARVLAARPAWRCLNPPDDVRELFDKRRTSARFAAAGVPVPPSLPSEGPARALEERLLDQGERQVFVKLASGSSASCLGIWTLGPRPSFLTTIEVARTGWYNSLRLRRYERRARIHELVDWLLREGSQVERAIPKARVEGRYFDLRVLVVGGEPAFRVVRTSPHPITNLHLGGRRGDAAALGVGDAVWAGIEATGRAVGALYPRTLHVGVDVLVEADRRGHRVVEANAFGDLLPGLEREGLSVQGWEIEVAERG